MTKDKAGKEGRGLMWSIHGFGLESLLLKKKHFWQVSDLVRSVFKADQAIFSEADGARKASQDAM